MAKSLVTFVCVLLLVFSLAHAAPKPQPQNAVAANEAADLESGAGVESEKDDLQGSQSIGYGYYSYPYLGGYYGGGGYGLGGYYPYYSGVYGLGYPYYGGYYGGLHHGYHGHYF